MTWATKDIEPEGEAPAWKKATNKRKDSAKKERRSKAEEFEEVVKNRNFGEPPTVLDVISWYSSTGKEVAERTVRDWIKNMATKLIGQSASELSKRKTKKMSKLRRQS
ncbi:hypothetical protein P7H06_14960 [Paenibacillus larvae]|nr:hypothetical protein [Paenibacillus larvae]MDT2260535.1 hypothetical protein [Paenibacillus larvae]